jgi:hypothetical protein
MIKLKDNKEGVASISTPLILIGILKGYIRKPVIFIIHSSIKFKKFKKTINIDLPNDLIDTTGFIAWLYIQLKKEIGQKKAFEIIRVALLTSGFALQQANFRNVEEERTFSNLIKNQKKANSAGSTKYNTMEIIEETSSKYNFHVKRCVFYELFEHLKVPELITIMCAVDNAIFNTYLPDRVFFNRDGENNTIPKGGKYCNFIIAKNNDNC